MIIRLLAFATARDAIGHEQIDVALPEGARLSDLAARLQADYPDLVAIWSRLALAIDGELAEPDAPLSDGSEIALLPPVSGGAPLGRARLVDAVIDLEAIWNDVADPACGAVLLFVGTVRDHHQDKIVARIDYEAYRPMALEALEAIAGDLEASSPRLRVRIVHRLGEIPVGEASVVIAVASAHRASAYGASREALERLKKEVPIWKKEYYADGEIAWREEEPLAHPS